MHKTQLHNGICECSFESSKQDFESNFPSTFCISMFSLVSAFLQKFSVLVSFRNFSWSLKYLQLALGLNNSTLQTTWTRYDVAIYAKPFLVNIVIESVKIINSSLMMNSRRNSPLEHAVSLLLKNPYASHRDLKPLLNAASPIHRKLCCINVELEKMLKTKNGRNPTKLRLEKSFSKNGTLQFFFGLNWKKFTQKIQVSRFYFFIYYSVCLF